MARVIEVIQGDTLPVIELSLFTRGTGTNPDVPFDITDEMVHIDVLVVEPSTEEIVKKIVGVEYTVEDATNEVRVATTGGVLDIPTGEYQLWALITDRREATPREQHIKGRPPQRLRVTGGPT